MKPRKTVKCNGCGCTRRKVNVRARKPCSRCCWIEGAENVKSTAGGSGWTQPAAEGGPDTNARRTDPETTYGPAGGLTLHAKVTIDVDPRAEILRRCRATGPGRWVMRELGGVCMVIDLGQTEPVPGSKYSWERRDKVIAEGDSWAGILEELSYGKSD